MIGHRSRSDRLAEIRGLTFHEVIERKLLERADWVALAGAVYPKERRWRRDRCGRVKYCGPTVQHNDKVRHIARADTYERKFRNGQFSWTKKGTR